MFLDLNTQVSVADLMRGLIIVSGNDAAVALAEHTSGSQQAFIDQMNKFGQQFGLKILTLRPCTVWTTRINTHRHVIWRLSVRM